VSPKIFIPPGGVGKGTSVSGARILQKQVYEMEQRRIRVLVAKPGLDGHDRGAKVVARALRDAGMEVIYTGLRQTPEMIVEAALQEDVDVVGLSVLSGAHLTWVPKVTALLKARGADDVLVLVGGIIPQADVPVLQEAGVQGIFGPGTPTTDIARFIEERLGRTAAGVPTGAAH